MSNKLTITDLNGSVTEIELENLDEKIESIVAYRLRQRTRELKTAEAALAAAQARVAELEAENADLRGLPMSAHTRKLGALHRENEELRQHIAALESQLAAQAWRLMETVPDGEDVELLVHGYIGDDGHWYYRDGTEPMRGWRPID